MKRLSEGLGSVVFALVVALAVVFFRKQLAIWALIAVGICAAVLLVNGCRWLLEWWHDGAFGTVISFQFLDTVSEAIIENGSWIGNRTIKVPRYQRVEFIADNGLQRFVNRDRDERHFYGQRIQLR